jgi:hypothetical protein
LQTLIEPLPGDWKGNKLVTGTIPILRHSTDHINDSKDWSFAPQKTTATRVARHLTST